MREHRGRWSRCRTGTPSPTHPHAWCEAPGRENCGADGTCAGAGVFARCPRTIGARRSQAGGQAQCRRCADAYPKRGAPLCRPRTQLEVGVATPKTVRGSLGEAWTSPRRSWKSSAASPGELPSRARSAKRRKVTKHRPTPSSTPSSIVTRSPGRSRRPWTQAPGPSTAAWKVHDPPAAGGARNSP